MFFSTVKINSHLPDAVTLLTIQMQNLLPRVNPQKKPLLFVCIGSAGFPGDRLGPQVGTLLTEGGLPHVLGTLTAPIHAENLSGFLQRPPFTDSQFCIVAIDAAIGSARQAGYIYIKKGHLLPGRGVGKKLPPVGDLYITGVMETLCAPSTDFHLPVLTRSISESLCRLCT